jgi:CspA family cold shock protein
MPIGTVKWYDGSKGYGFIEQEDGPDVFVHRSNLNMPDLVSLTEGLRVKFDIEPAEKGPVAKNVTVI